MKKHNQPQTILQQMALIQRMERGKLCAMGGGAYYNHQTWENGRNLVRYVPRERVADLKKAIAGYQQYQKLSKAYADQIIHLTRQNPSTPASASAKEAMQNNMNKFRWFGFP